jgi:hypothetical protein
MKTLRNVRRMIGIASLACLFMSALGYALHWPFAINYPLLGIGFVLLGLNLFLMFWLERRQPPEPKGTDG